MSGAEGRAGEGGTHLDCGGAQTGLGVAGRAVLRFGLRLGDEEGLGYGLGFGWGCADPVHDCEACGGDFESHG